MLIQDCTNFVFHFIWKGMVGWGERDRKNERAYTNVQMSSSTHWYSPNTTAAKTELGQEQKAGNSIQVSYMSSKDPNTWVMHQSCLSSALRNARLEAKKQELELGTPI